MSKSIQIIVQGQDGVVSTSNIKAGSGKGGQPLVLRALPGVAYELRDAEKQVAPDQVMIRRHGKNLELVLDIEGKQAGGNAPADVVIEGYFDLKDPSPITGLSENGQYYAYVPQDGQVESLSWELKDGAASYQGLGYDDAGSAVPWWPFLLAGLVLLGGAAASGGGGGGGKGGAGVVSRPVAELEEDSGNPTDGITNNGQITVTNLLPGGSWSYSIDSGATWIPGTASNTFTLAEGSYTQDQVQVKQANSGGTESDVTKLGPMVVDTTGPTPPTVELVSEADALLGLRPDYEIAGRPAPTSSVKNALLVKDIEPDHHWEYSLDGGVTWTAGTGNHLLLTDGTYHANAIQIVQVDMAGNRSPAFKQPAVVIDTLPPPAPTQLVVSADGLKLTGKGEPKAYVEVKDENGAIIGTGTVSAGGNINITLNSAQKNGESLEVMLVDLAGHESPEVIVIAGDLTPPNKATDMVVSDDGLTLTGKGEPGATVHVKAVVDGANLNSATAIVNADGNFVVILTTPQKNGEKLVVNLKDAKGNTSSPEYVDAKDLTSPDAPTQVSINQAGTVVTGFGEKGATAIVTIAAGTDDKVEFEAIINSDGRFSVTINPAQLDAEKIDVHLEDIKGNKSSTVTIVAPDTTPPEAPDVTMDADGKTITGTAEAKEEGAEVIVRDAAGTQIGTGTVAEGGVINVVLDVQPKLNGESLKVYIKDLRGNLSLPADLNAPDSTPPEPASNLVVNDVGLELQGRGEPGATVTVTGIDVVDGEEVDVILGTGTVGSDGRFTIPLSEAQISGEELTVVLKDAIGNESDPSTVNAPEAGAPLSPTDLAISADGALLTGKGLKDAIIRVKDANGNPIPHDGEVIVDEDGNFTLTFTPPLTNGETVSVTQTNLQNNLTSSPSMVDAPDLIAPDAPSDLIISNDGLVLTGKGQPGAKITVKLDGDVIAPVSPAEVIVALNGTFTLPLSPALLNGETVEVIQTDAGGDSLPGTATALDTTAPNPPTNVDISDDGTEITGEGEPGTTVVIRDEDGNEVETGTVDPDGTFTVILDPPRNDGSDLTVELVDDRDNTSDPVVVTAPDNVKPDPAENLKVSLDGLTVTGEGEPGTTVTIRDGNAVIGTGIVDNTGNFSVPLLEAKTNGEELTVTLTDSAGNNSDDANVDAFDTTPPAQPENLTITEDGTEIEGTGEPGTTVSVKHNDIEVGAAQVGSNGNFVVILSPAQTNGQVLKVTLMDAAENESTPVFIDAYYDFDVDDVSHDVKVIITPEETDFTSEEKVTKQTGGLLGLKLVDLLDLSLLINNDNVIEVIVEEGQTKTLQIQGTGGGLLSVADFDLLLIKSLGANDDNNAQVAIHEQIENWFYSPLIGITTSDVRTFELQAGRYFFAMKSDTDVSLIKSSSLSVISGVTRDYKDFDTVVLGEPSGSIFALGSNGTEIPAGSVLIDVDGIVVSGTDTFDIVGDFGTLKVKADGSYTYELSADYLNDPTFSAKESFSYTVQAPNGKGQSSGTIEIDLTFNIPGSNTQVANRPENESYEGIDFDALEQEDAANEVPDELPELDLILTSNGDSGQIDLGDADENQEQPSCASYINNTENLIVFFDNSINEDDKLDGGYQA